MLKTVRVQGPVRLLVLAIALIACEEVPPPPTTFDLGTLDDGGTRDIGQRPGDGGGTRDVGVISGTTFDPNEVYLLGTFQPGSCGRDAVVDLVNGGRPLAGFPCQTVSPFVVRPSDGRLLYLAGGDREIRVFAPDAWSGTPSNLSYPSDPAANDGTIATPECRSVGHFVLNPETEKAYYRCSLCGDVNDCFGRWYESGGGGEYAPAGDEQTWLPGYDGSMLVYGSTSPHVVHGGETVPLDGWLGTVGFVRPRRDGFDVVINNNAAPDVDHVAFDGTVTPIANYPSRSDTFTGLGGCVVDANRSVYCRSRRAGADTSAGDVVLRFDPGASAEVVVQDDQESSLVQQHISWLFTGL